MPRLMFLWAALLAPPCPDPPLSDLDMLPPEEAVESAIAFNAAYRRRLELRLPLELWHASEIATVIREAERCAEPWELIAQARQTYECDSGEWLNDYRRGRLAELRRLLGYDGYLRMLTTWKMPPCVPLGRFQELP